VLTKGLSGCDKTALATGEGDAVLPAITSPPEPLAMHTLFVRHKLSQSSVSRYKLPFSSTKKGFELQVGIAK